MDHTEVTLVAIPVIGITCLWVAARLKIPAILLLLGAGLIAGPATGFINPDELFGEDLLFSGVSVAVGVLLYQGGLGLRLDRLSGGTVVLRLVTVGVLLTWLVGGATAYLLFSDGGLGPALVLGAVVVVSGPTVVLPILAQIRPRDPVNTILRWEGIVIDPVGATLGIVTVGAVLAASTGASETGAVAALLAILYTAGAGLVVGTALGFGLAEALRRHWISDHLQPVVTLMVVLAAFGIADVVSAEAGLFATTTLGVVLANQRRAPVAHIATVGETIEYLLLGSLFIVLGASVQPEPLVETLIPGLVLAAMLVGVARPLAVLASTFGTSLERRERIFLVFVAPRGIVAAATGPLFATELLGAGLDADYVAPATFVVIIATVLFYSLAAPRALKRVRLDRPAPHGIALIGAPRWALGLAQELTTNEVPVILVSNDEAEIADATAEGLLVHNGRIDREDLTDTIDGAGIRQALAVGHSNELNELGLDRLADLVGRANLFLLPVDDDGHTDGRRGSSLAVRAHRPFSSTSDQRSIEALLAGGWVFDTVELAEASIDPDRAVPMVTIDEQRRPKVVTEPDELPQVGTAIVLRAPG
jgi:NhaP-type Na+/H+ or K+/H+ antiporter